MSVRIGPDRIRDLLGLGLRAVLAARIASCAASSCAAASSAAFCSADLRPDLFVGVVGAMVVVVVVDKKR